MNPKELKLIRLLLGIIVIILVLFILFIFLAIPSVNYYKKQNAAFVGVKTEYDRIKQQHTSALEVLLDLKSKNRRAIEAFENEFDEKKFVSYLQTMFENVSLEKSEANSDEKFLRYDIKVTTSMQTPMKFYAFLSDLNTFSNILEVEFPIEFEMVDGALQGSFHMRKYHYKIKTK
jgi:wobble nucleotide-excising tRNase